MNDPAFVNDILKTLPGVDMNDPQIKVRNREGNKTKTHCFDSSQSILAEMGGQPTGDDDLEQALKMSMDVQKKEDKEEKKEGQ